MALAGAADTMYICWKGKQPPLEKCWQGLKGSQSITNRLIKDVPVMAPGKLPRVEAATRQSILVESIVAAPVEARDSESEGEEEDNKATRKYKKRNRKMRRAATDTSRVLLFANVPAPQFIHALVNWKKAREGLNAGRLARRYPSMTQKADIPKMVSRIRCWNCRDRGHLSRDCPKPRRSDAKGKGKGKGKK